MNPKLVGKMVVLLLPFEIALFPCCAAEGNLVKNPGFEEGADSWSFQTPRTSGPDAKLNLGIDRQVAHSGKASARLSLDFSENAQLYCPMQVVSVFPDTEYVLSAFVKAELESGAIHLELQDARGWKLLLKNSIQLSGQHEWAKVEVPFRTSLSTEGVKIGLRHVGRPGDKQPMKGQVWLDDVVLATQGTDRPRLSREDLEKAIRDSKLITLKNEVVEIAFSEPRLRIRSVGWKRRPDLQLSPGLLPEAPLYVIQIQSAGGQRAEVRSLDAQSVSVEELKSGTPRSHLLRARHASGVSSVSIRVVLHDSGCVDLQLEQVALEPGWAITELLFPQMVTRGVLSGDPKDTLVGVGGAEPVSLGKGWGWEFRDRVYPVSARIPLLCQQGKNGGPYLLALDGDQWVKTVEMQPYLDAAGKIPTALAWRYGVKMAKGDKLPKYAARLGLLEHSPYEAAEAYREWARGQPWFPKPLGQRRDIGSWRLRGVPHYFIYLPESGPNMLPKHPRDMTAEERAKLQNKPGGGRFRLREVPAAMEALPKEITELGGVVDLRGWEKWGLWMNPDWWPPRQGEATLRQATEAIHNAGLHVTADVMFYNLKIHLPKDEHGFGEAGRRALQKLGIVPGEVAMKDERGNTISTGAGIYRGNVVCPTASVPFEHAVSTLTRMKEAGFDDVQFDGGGHSIQLPCWNEKHPHPPGPGYWQTAVAKDYYERVRDAIPGSRESGFGFVEEYFNEVRAHSYAAIYTRCEQVRHVRKRVEALAPNARMTPLPSMFSFVYHGRVIETGFFGSYGPAAYATASNMAFGVCAGPQPTPWLTFGDILNEPWVKIFLAGTKARQTFARDYLLLGEMLRPLATEPWVTLKIGLKDEKTGKWRSKQVQVPAVIQQAYRSPAGKIGWVLVNHTDQRVTCLPQQPFPAWFAELSSSQAIRRITVNGAEPFRPAGLRRCIVEPAEVVLLEEG